MLQWIQRNIVVLAVGVVIAGVSFGARWNDKSAANTPKEQNTNTQRTEGTTMPTATLSQGTVFHANESNFDDLVLTSDVPVLVDFYADWCGPCRMLAPLLEELAKETSDAKIVKVNVDHAPQLARRYGIQSIPSLKVFDGGEVVDEHVGLANKGQLKSMLDI